MRLNQFIAQHTGVSRRQADQLIKDGEVEVNGVTASLGQNVSEPDKVVVGGLKVRPSTKIITIMLNKPVGYVCSRNGQGSKTIYDLLPAEFHNLKPVGRLDKDSSGLLLLTNDGQMANQLTHPRYQKEKVYEVELDKPLAPEDKTKIEQGVMLQDGVSKLEIKPLGANQLQVKMSEGRNRQIRRTFAALNYKVTKLHRTHFGNYKVAALKSGEFKKL